MTDIQTAPAPLAAHYRFGETAPDRVDGEIERWLAPAVNFVVEMTRAPAGSTVRVSDQTDEYCVLAATGTARIRVTAGTESVTTQDNSLVFVPPGDSELHFLEDGYIYCVFSRDSPVHRAAAALSRVTSPAHSVDPIRPWSVPPGGYILRSYKIDDAQRGGQVFRCTNLMLSVIKPGDEPRPTNRLSPHLHDGFEQGCLVNRGSYVHHIRRAWGTDGTKWRDDEHTRVDAPTVSVIAPPDLHTSQNIGAGPFQHIDIFCPPRIDFIEDGSVKNLEDYPWPEAAQ